MSEYTSWSTQTIAQLVVGCSMAPILMVLMDCGMKFDVMLSGTAMDMVKGGYVI